MDEDDLKDLLWVAAKILLMTAGMMIVIASLHSMGIDLWLTTKGE